MTLPWFRMYGEFLTDPLIRLLSFEDQRHFIAALCMKASGVTDKCYASVTVRVTVISSLIGLSKEPGADGQSALDKANERLKSLGLVDDNWQPINWNKRQFQSDHTDKTSAERMRRMRAKKRSTVTGDVTVTRVTPVEQIQNRTDTEQNKNKTVALAPIDGLDLETWNRWVEYRQQSGKPLKRASLSAAQKKLAAFGPSQAAVVEESIANGYQGLFAPKANGRHITPGGKWE